jgi:hypothetical protein
MVNYFEDLVSVNCQACGGEFERKALSTIQLSGLKTAIHVCASCSSKTAYDSFKDAADILGDIVSIARFDEDPESRLQKIIKLLNG